MGLAHPANVWLDAQANIIVQCHTSWFWHGRAQCGSFGSATIKLKVAHVYMRRFGSGVGPTHFSQDVNHPISAKGLLHKGRSPAKALGSFYEWVSRPILSIRHLVGSGHVSPPLTRRRKIFRPLGKTKAMNNIQDWYSTTKTKFTWSRYRGNLNGQFHLEFVHWVLFRRPYQRTPMGNHYISPIEWVFIGYNPQEYLENTINTMGTLLGVHPIVPWIFVSHIHIT